ncbi:PREDICTED: arf-GAP with dual PH domain-containing protein 2 isoform X4 [Myotis davidii]|uniref:arf-GAP with dual PH domain-containing protein 2 isoform X4 n=1 Tax=Myotis davidii TaxID=225400 RepID=UPI000766E88F|nr:PREDICTED: arf-GAP with dual PH domain-containing protein 2 isoform X4 [Myotis davidii]
MKPESPLSITSLRPATACEVLKEQWIRAKYERQEFMADGKTISLSGNREGFLWKRGRDNAQFLRRRFVLLSREGLLKYYTKEEGKSPKAVIHIKDLNATFQTEKIGNPHGLQITYRREGHIRNLFVYHESGKEIVDWFNALRAARLQYLKAAFPELPESELVPLITRNYLKQGFMEKTGPKQREPFKKRWFALDPQERRLIYYKNPLLHQQRVATAAGDPLAKARAGHGPWELLVRRRRSQLGLGYPAGVPRSWQPSLAVNSAKTKALAFTHRLPGPHQGTVLRPRTSPVKALQWEGAHSITQVACWPQNRLIRLDHEEIVYSVKQLAWTPQCQHRDRGSGVQTVLVTGD